MILSVVYRLLVLQARKDAGLRKPRSFMGGKEVTNSAGCDV